MSAARPTVNRILLRPQRLGRLYSRPRRCGRSRMRFTVGRAALMLFVAVAAIRCGPRESEGSPPAAAAAAATISADTITLAFDYAGAEAVIGALERDSLTTADVDSLLRVRGVRAMVDNVTR